MDKIETSEWECQKLSFQRIFRGLTGRSIKIYDTKEGQLGYTAADGTIHLAKNHPVMAGLNNTERNFFRMGVFAHETLHQIFSDFNILKKESEILEAENPTKARVYGEIFNLIEDPAIEYMAPSQMGGSLLKSLKFSIKKIWEKSPNLEEMKTPYLQYTGALCMFGDMGILRGEFTFSEARDAFKKTAQIFNDAVENPSPKERSDAALEITEIIKNLWEGLEIPESETHKNQNTIAPLSNSEDSGVRRDSKAEARRKLIASTEFKENPDKGVSSSDSSKKSEGLENSKPEEIKITDEDLDFLKKQDEASAKAVEPEKPGEIDPSVKQDYYEENLFSCVNVDVTIDPGSAAYYAEKYNRFLANNSGSIASFTKRMEKIFRQKKSEKEYKKTGKLSVERYICKNTARVFTKRSEPKALASLAVEILVDCSGSMNMTIGQKKIDGRFYHFTRMEVAREVAMCLAEAFSRLKIPCYVMGFTADYGADANHYHFVKWKNTLTERQSLLQMEELYDNFDSFSISYAAANLRKRREEHKLLVVISDGRPSAVSFMHFTGSAMAQTKEAIRKARKTCDVLGVAIGNDSTEEIHYLYGKDFLHVNDLADVVFAQISMTIEKIVKRW